MNVFGAIRRASNVTPKHYTVLYYQSRTNRRINSTFFTLSHRCYGIFNFYVLCLRFMWQA